MLQPSLTKFRKALVSAILIGLVTLGLGESAARLLLSRSQIQEVRQRVARAADRIQHSSEQSSELIFVLNSFWGYGYRRGLAALRHLDTLSGDYQYNVSREEYESILAGIAANNHGFFSTFDYPYNEDGSYIVGIFGGSVANFWYCLSHEEIKRNLELLLGREVVVLNFALGAAHQPQQAMILTYFGSIGQKFDLIINLDGFNEVTIPSRHADSNTSTAAPFAGVFFALSPSDDQDLAVLRSEAIIRQRALQKMTIRASKLFSWNSRFARSRLLDWGAFALYRFAETRNSKAAQALERGGVTKYDSLITPPFVLQKGETDAVDQGIRNWMRSAYAMQALSQSIGARYFEFLQPSQYLSRKSFTKVERTIAFGHHRVWAQGYRRLIANQSALRSAGVEIYDLLGIFDTVRDTVFVDDCCHINVLGNRILTDQIMLHIRAEMVLEQRH
jgi:hypothetical protein